MAPWPRRAPWSRRWLAACRGSNGSRRPRSTPTARLPARRRSTPGGKPIIALPSTAKGGTISRIVPVLREGAAVVASRAHVQWVATEHGVAHLHGRSIRERARALIAIADPAFRDELAAFDRAHYGLQEVTVHPQLAKAPPPTDDRRWRVVDAAMRRHGYQPEGLIEALHAVQQTFGFLDEAALRYVASNLAVPPSRVYGVATFYHYFTLKPQGEHTCVVCTGTACYIKGSSALLAAISDAYGIAAGETTEDGKLSLLTARCLGTCALAPAAVLDGQVVGLLEPPVLLERLAALVGRSAAMAGAGRGRDDA